MYINIKCLNWRVLAPILCEFSYNLLFIVTEMFKEKFCMKSTIRVELSASAASITRAIKYVPIAVWNLTI